MKTFAPRTMRPVAYIESPLKQKFGTPRQSGLAGVKARIMLLPPYDRMDAVRGLESFSHIWLLWEFSAVPGGTQHEAVADGQPSAAEQQIAAAGRSANAAVQPMNAAGQPESVRTQHKAAAAAHENAAGTPDGAAVQPASGGTQMNAAGTHENAAGTPDSAAVQPAAAPRFLTVRPPRLGGKTRVGVFASRAPYRPNGIGLSCVVLDRVTEEQGRPVLEVTGADLVDGTPIYDIKPYLAYTDSRPEARDGFAGARGAYRLTVLLPEPLAQRLGADAAAVTDLLAEDPRPAYQTDPARIYGMAYGPWNVRFRIEEKTLTVLAVEERVEERKEESK